MRNNGRSGTILRAQRKLSFLVVIKKRLTTISSRHFFFAEFSDLIVWSMPSSASSSRE